VDGAKMIKVKNAKYQNYLFNFSSSYSGGGLKRLMAYISWFHRRGGAHFIVNKRLDGQLTKFDANNYHYVDICGIEKFLNKQTYVERIIASIGRCDFYYSYNVPMKDFRANVRWFHLSNVLPLCGTRGLSIPSRRRIELWWLGVITKQGLRNCDIASAESKFSLNLLRDDGGIKRAISTNGVDNEIGVMTRCSDYNVEKLAVIIGTYFHKNIDDSYKVYQYLKRSHPTLNLVIIGDPKTVPDHVKQDTSVILKGVIKHDEALKVLSRAIFYISTSLMENSWNAASEGVMLAQESILSKIPPHLELLEGSEYTVLDKIKTRNPMLCIKRGKLNSDKLKTWDEIIFDMIVLSEKSDVTWKS
jgi:glycosyltransferase involved in cell wall biosynthesis